LKSNGLAELASASMHEQEHCGALRWFAARTRPSTEEFVRKSVAELEGVNEVFLPRFAHDLSAAYRAGQLLFPGYVFFQSEGNDDVFDWVRSHESVSYLLGPSTGTPTVVREDEIGFLKKLTHTPHVELVHLLPERGRKARIISGSFAGVTGIVTKVSLREVRMRSLIEILGRVVEISVRPDQLEIIEFIEGASTRKPRHRAGRRARRSSKRGDS